MSTTECQRWHGAMAMDALGTLPQHEHAGLLAHLDGCTECREEVGDLVSTAGFLNLIEPSELDQVASVSPELTGRVLGQLHQGQLRARRRRGVAVLVGAAVAASVISIVALSASSPAPRTNVVIAHLIGPNSAAATVTLAARSWGTSVTLSEGRQQNRGVFTVSMRTASGVWWPTGSYYGVAGKPLDAEMTCAFPPSQITAIKVTNERGTTILWSESASVPRW